ncbi:hypothetical protein BST95_04150 [Halioglobus japonicus]|uniref:DUF3012 domain-containing protein n=1 Tax=Halioglobus japonicus TaxID=930805 RepID=A0AAP8MCV3_9GAMM|nr:DUF3012 domain-containing protein [Halioglobus japonicus]AQA20134.1 hypothetical protein BST95_04150 [Halioglobus japonicus]PLW85481.1 DUF3012 domain-containing protein [Halioglobus japonicus]
MKRTFLATGLIAGALILSACSAEPGSERWCNEKKEQPKSEWTGGDAATFAKNCIIDGSEVGSEKWCEKLSEKDKGEWTASEASTFAKHCVM